MLIYINNEDLRTNQLCNYFMDSNHKITTNKSDINQCDICYFGIWGKDHVDVQLKKDCSVYTLSFNEDIKILCKNFNSKYTVLYENQDVVKANAILTTEALLSYIISNNNISIHNSNVLVMGYGVCGKDISKKIHAMGAKVTVSNRNNKYKNEVIKTGLSYDTFECIDLSKYDFIINTVPFPVFTKEILDTLKASCKFYDIASAPYGVEENNRFEYYKLLPALPSKYAYKTAAYLIYDFISKRECLNV